jgi:hypothetical protein
MSIFKTIKESVIIFLFTISVLSCKKASEDSNNCKTCKALNANGTVAAQRQTCTTADEQAFRAENAGKEITCN